MQTDEEVGKVAAAVPIMISRTLELFVESLLLKTMEITSARQARTLSPSHMRQCIMSESRFDFLRELVKDIPNMSWNDDFLPGESAGAVDVPVSAPAPAPPAIMPAHTPSHLNGNSYNMMTTGGIMDRPRRYQRPISYDETSDNHNYTVKAMPSSIRESKATDSPTGILKRKLLDLSRKYASSDGTSGTHNNTGHGKLARLDSSPAAFGEQSEALSLTTRRRRRSNEEVPLPMSPRPPTVNISTGTMSTPVIKIDYNQSPFSLGDGPGTPEITPVINIDFSSLISPMTTADVASNGGNKLSLSTAVEVKSTAPATPNLTTPTSLNFVVPPFQATPPAVSAFPASAANSALEMDEDYDDI